MSNKEVNVLFVCLGNICRSPTAHGVFEKKIKQAGLNHLIKIDSAGTSDWHVGSPPDTRSITEAAKRGYDLSELRGRQAVPEDFHQFDYILAMDKENLNNLKLIAPANGRAQLELFLSYASGFELEEVPDPYSGGQAGFTHVLDMVEDACDGLFTHIKEKHL